METQKDTARELTLLEHVESDPDVNQATLASQLGVAVGTVNWHLKRLVAKGYVKVQRAERKKLRYIITPEGIALRARLTVDYIERSFDLYRRTRARIKEQLDDIRATGQTRVRIMGEGDVADICRLTCLEQGFSIVNDCHVPNAGREGLEGDPGDGRRGVNEPRHVVITGGAGYIGSLLTAELLRAGNWVTVIDSLLFGGESLVAFLPHPRFRFVKGDVTDSRALRDGSAQRPGEREPLAAPSGRDPSGCHRWLPGVPGRRPAGGMALQRGGDKAGLGAGQRSRCRALPLLLDLQQLRSWRPMASPSPKSRR